MKNLMLIIVLLSMASCAVGQKVQSGDLVGTHIITVTPKPGVTLDQVLDFYRNKWIPEREKAFEGFNLHVGKGIRGDVENKIFLLFIFDSAAARNKYFKPEGGYHELNELGIKAWQQGQAVQDELESMATLETQWADWVLQN